MTALITGASSGIGRSLALVFARHGYDVVLVARTESALNELAGEISRLGRSARVLSADLSTPGSARQLVERLERESLAIDVVVNNAGFGLRGEFADLPFDRQLAMIELNVATLTALSHLLLPGMRARRLGGILNVASTAGFQPGPLMAVYYATKAYVLSFTEALAEELADTPLKISCLCPGPTQSAFADVASMRDTRLFKRQVMSSDEVAAAGFDGWARGKRTVIPGWANRFGAFSIRISPRRGVVKVVKRLNETA